MSRLTNKGEYTNIPAIGAATAGWGPVFQLTAPVDADFAWINQGSAAITDYGDSLALTNPAEAGPALHVRKKAAPSTPYTITIGFLMVCPRANYFGAGFCWRQSSDGKIVDASIGADATSAGVVAVNNWNSATSFNATVTAPIVIGAYCNTFFIRATDDGANRIVSWSQDGQDFFLLSTVARTSFMTADEVGFFIKGQNATYNTAMTLVSWIQT